MQRIAIWAIIVVAFVLSGCQITRVEVIRGPQEEVKLAVQFHNN